MAMALMATALMAMALMATALLATVYGLLATVYGPPGYGYTALLATGTERPRNALI